MTAYRCLHPSCARIQGLMAVCLNLRTWGSCQFASAFGSPCMLQVVPRKLPIAGSACPDYNGQTYSSRLVVAHAALQQGVFEIRFYFNKLHSECASRKHCVTARTCTCGKMLKCPIAWKKHCPKYENATKPTPRFQRPASYSSSRTAP